MRKLFSLFLALVATTSLLAYDFQSGDLYYNITSSSAPYTVEVSDVVSSITSADIPSTVTHNGTTYSVTSIGESAFEDCSSLPSVTIPNSVTSIGGHAFSGCFSLTSIGIPNSVTSIGEWAFYGCSYLTSITIPNSVTSIGDWAFSSCFSLTTPVYNAHCFAYMPTSFEGAYVIPEGIKQIAGGAFADCSSLTSITIPNSVTSIGDEAFRGCSSLTTPVYNAHCFAYMPTSFKGAYVIPEGIKQIAGRAFADCSSLTSVTIPNSVTSIGDEAFRGCSSLTSITIPNSVTSIGDFAFYDCSSLTTPVYNAHCFACLPTSFEGTYTVPDGIKQIAGGAFSDCSSLTSITIPNSVTSIGDYAFVYCSSLSSITIPNSVTSIGDRAFRDCSSLTSITISNSVTSIGNYAFYGCSSLTSITIPNSVTSIGDFAFGWCSSLTSITIPNNVTSIGNYAFGWCSSLTSITIGNSVTSIGDRAFSSCSSLTSITCEATTPPTLGSNVFYGVSTSIPVYVPCGSENIYKAAYAWKEFTNIQEPQVEYTIQVSTSNSQMGTAIVNYNSCAGNQISATANIGYHFVQWSDGNTDNPRTIVLTQDTTLTAEFAPNTYTITTVSSDTLRGTTQGDTTVNYLDIVTICANASYGYHFTQWNDANIENPRQVQVTGDATYIATFDKNTYAISLSCNEEQGSVEGVTSAEYLDTVTISATPNIGYHFVKWSDGNTDNSRTIVLTQDTTLTAEFAPNTYTITTVSSDTLRGTTQGDTTVNYLENVTISATANYGYHFSHWNDYNYDNPRQVQVTKDMTYSAYFDKNTYYITKKYNSNQGYVNGSTSGKYLDNITLTAEPNCGYHFLQWSDGNTGNPRTITLTQDTVLTAEFAQSFSGQCGDNLYWNYDTITQTISITGSGEMYNYTAATQPWLLFKEEIKEVTIANTATSIGTSAFEGCIRLGKISLGTGLKNIAANAFAGCTRLYDIYVYATYPPFAAESSFANYNVYVYIPCEYQRDYILDVVWGKFKFIECIGAESEEVPTDSVVVSPGSTDVTITWPTEEGADTYTIVIKKDGEVFCTITFNAEGQLLNIAFAPGRDGNHPAQYAEAVANGGYRFTVTGLEEGTHYTYNIDVKNTANQTINSHTGAFTTQSTTAVDNVTTNNANTQKLLRNGQLIILRDGVEYDAMGQEIQ